MAMEDFKEFVKNKPYLKEKVDKGETTWQELYEKYDLFGEDDEIFKENNSKKEKKDDSLSHILDMLSEVDINRISEGLNGMKKILNIINEVTTSDNEFLNKKRSHPYQRKDD